LTLKWKARFQLVTRFAIVDVLNGATSVANDSTHFPVACADRAAAFFSSLSPPESLRVPAFNASLHARAVPSS